MIKFHFELTALNARRTPRHEVGFDGQFCVLLFARSLCLLSAQPLFKGARARMFACVRVHVRAGDAGDVCACKDFEKLD